MFGFGDDFSIEIQQVPWLFWANLLVMLLLLFLLYYLISIMGFEGADTAPSAPAQKSKDFDFRSYRASASTGTSTTMTRKIFPGQLIKMKEDQSHPTVIVEKITSTSSRRRNGESLVFDEPSVRKTMETSESYLPYGPCSWLELARRVFLKCLGLDVATSSTSQDN